MMSRTRTMNPIIPPPVPACHGFADWTVIGAASTRRNMESWRRAESTRLNILAVWWVEVDYVEGFWYTGGRERRQQSRAVAWFCGRAGAELLELSVGTGRVRHACHARNFAAAKSSILCAPESFRVRSILSGKRNSLCLLHSPAA
jgi:hypothetical protein